MSTFYFFPSKQESSNLYAHCPSKTGSPSLSTFRYEALWERETTLQPTIEECWKKMGAAANLAEIQKKIHDMQQSLSKWSATRIGSITRQTGSLRKRLKWLMHKPPCEANDREIRKVSAELDEMLLREEILWRQRSRATYIREGYRNTEWFHRQATWRRKQNTIMKLKNGQGQWVEEREDLQKNVH